MWDPYADFEKFVLPNGLTVFVSTWPERDWEYMGFIVHAGAKDDPEGLEGLAHFCEHRLTKDARLDHEQICENFIKAGGNCTLGTTKTNKTVFDFFAPAKQRFISKVLQLFSKILFNAKFECDLAKEKRVIKSEYDEKYSDKFRFDTAKRWKQAIYLGNWRSRVIDGLGTPETIWRIENSDLSCFYNRYYIPQNISIVALGGMKKQKIISLLTDNGFDIFKEGKENPLLIPISKISPPTENLYEYIIPNKGAGYFSYVAIPGVISPFALIILNNMVGNALMNKLRWKKNFIYGIRTQIRTNSDIQEFYISAKGFPNNQIKEIMDLIEITLQEAINVILFRKIRKILCAPNLIDVSGSNVFQSAMDNIGDTRKIFSLKEGNENFKKVTFSDIKEAAQYLLPENRFTMIRKSDK